MKKEHKRHDNGYQITRSSQRIQLAYTRRKALNIVDQSATMNLDHGLRINPTWIILTILYKARTFKVKLHSFFHS